MMINLYIQIWCNGAGMAAIKQDVNETVYKGLVRPILEHGSFVLDV